MQPIEDWRGESLINENNNEYSRIKFYYIYILFITNHAVHEERINP
jgi:hypothetical protein